MDYTLQAQFGYSYACSKLPASAAPSVRDAFNVDFLCANFSEAEFLMPDLRVSLELERTNNDATRAAVISALIPAAPTTTFFVAVNGSDSNDGTLSRPFASLPRAAAAVRALGPRTPGSTAVFVRAGTYYLGAAPLVLSEADSNVSWATYPGDAPVVLSGGVHLGTLNWQPWVGGVPGALVASVNVTAYVLARGSGEERAPSTPGRAGAPPLVSSLFVNGIRQARLAWQRLGESLLMYC